MMSKTVNMGGGVSMQGCLNAFKLEISNLK